MEKISPEEASTVVTASISGGVALVNCIAARHKRYASGYKWTFPFALMKEMIKERIGGVR